MKVLFIAGGTPHYYNLVLNKLNQFPDVEVVVVAPKGAGSTVGAGVHQTQEGIEFKMYHLEEYKTYYGKMFFRNIKQVIDNEQPNIIITNWPYTLAWIFFPMLYLKIRRKNIKIISKEIPFQVPYYDKAIEFYTQGGGISENNQAVQKNDGILSKLKYWFITEARKKMVNRVDAHINYFDEAIDIHASYGVDREKVFITANSPDTDLIFEAKESIKNSQDILPKNPFRIIHVGRLVKWKRVDMLMDVFNKLLTQFPTAELVIVGTGSEEQALKNQAIALGIEQNVVFTGGVYEMATLGQYFNASLVYVLAGMGGLSINDAMCFDKPIVCAVADGTEKKLVRDGYNGYIFEDGNAEDLFKKLTVLLSDPPKTRKMGMNSGQIIRDEVNIHIVIKNYQRAFAYCQ
jgi:glycosyltransferase involved in cell wall biosynthesis